MLEVLRSVNPSILLSLIVGGVVIGTIWTSVRTRHLLHPVFLISVGFFLPLAAATLRLSDLQASHWAYETYALALEAWLLWLVFPCVWLASAGRQDCWRPPERSDQRQGISAALMWYARILGILNIAAIILQNYLTGGLPILLVDPEVAFEYHTATVPILQILARASFAACALLHLAIYYRRRVIDVVLLLLVLLCPLTKLARIDLMLSAITLVLMNAYFPIVKLRSRKGFIGLAALVGLLLGLVELGNQRLNRFGRFSVSYGDAIGFRGYRGPAEAFAVAYGYFALSFENLDRFVKENPEYRTRGLLSFSPLFNAVFFVNRLTAGKYPGPDTIVDRRNPVGPMATVETALAPFYLDFGAGMAWVPMLFYMLVWLWLYSHRHRGLSYVIAYAGYSASMVLSAFQGVVAAPFIYQGLALALLPFLLPRLSAPPTAVVAGRSS